MPQENKRVSYKSLKIASVLYSFPNKCKLVGARKEGRDIAFIFEPADEAKGIADQYFAGDLRLDPRELFSRMESLKDRVFLGEEVINDS